MKTEAEIRERLARIEEMRSVVGKMGVDREAGMEKALALWIALLKWVLGEE